MTGDPKGCREQALRCEQLARYAVTEQGQQALLDLALAWRWLAGEIENTQTIVANLKEPTGPQQYTLKIVEQDRDVGLRFLSALILGWDRVPHSTQGWILRDALVMKDGDAPAGPEVLTAFLDAYKGEQPSA